MLAEKAGPGLWKAQIELRPATSTPAIATQPSAFFRLRGTHGSRIMSSMAKAESTISGRIRTKSAAPTVIIAPDLSSRKRPPKRRLKDGLRLTLLRQLLQP